VEKKRLITILSHRPHEIRQGYAAENSSAYWSKYSIHGTPRLLLSSTKNSRINCRWKTHSLVAVIFTRKIGEVRRGGSTGVILFAFWSVLAWNPTASVPKIHCLLRHLTNSHTALRMHVSKQKVDWILLYKVTPRDAFITFDLSAHFL
jgi:hypothetical protein